MSDEVYRKLANVLDTLPNGFPATENGVEIRLLKKVFEPDEAEIFCNLRLVYESPDQISKRTGLSPEGLADKLDSMWRRGLVESEPSGELRVYRMIPWLVGIYELQNKRLDKEFIDIWEEYAPTIGPPLVMTKPQLLQVVPVEKEIPTNYEALPYEKVSGIIENGKSFLVADCICRKFARMAGRGCDKPLEICLGISREPGAFDNNPSGWRVITKDETYELLQKAEDAALVHMTTNLENGHTFICNCCGCCDGQLTVIRDGLLKGTVNSHFYATIDAERCDGCGICADKRCQVGALEKVDGIYCVDTTKCIGCGLCASACPLDAIMLMHKNPETLTPPPKDQMDWYEKRAAARGVDFSAYK